jgi:anti-sigma-K factor RskA
VLDQIRTVRQLSPETTVTPLRRSLTQRLTMVAAAVFFVAAAGLGFVVFQQGQQLDDRVQAVQLEQVMRAEDAELLKLLNRDGGTVNAAFSRSQDRMLMLSDDLASPPAGKTYQVWAIDAAGQRSMGFLEPNNGDVAVTVSGFDEAIQVGVTVEPDGGSATPTMDELVMSGNLPAA